MIKAVVFDCYGTLVDTGNGSVKAAETILAARNSTVNVEQFYKKWKQLHHEICCSSPFKTEADAFLLSLERLYEIYSIDGRAQEDVTIMLDTLGNRFVYPEVLETLARLADSFELVIGSNSDHEPLMRDISRNQIHIANVHSSESLQAYKPNAIFFERLLSELKLAPHEVVYVGDSPVDDIEGSAQAGIRNIWINRKKGAFTGTVAPTYECEDLRGVGECLLSDPAH
ncbi:(S)-2-haloacid dehalogenase 4A [Paenibacillus solanacearum]|uniref:(S)-2-haloacid dehalogenase 4A n=1 Tax=Paenibacillus solanacearum TaxID=2048548 RepID=A0A916JSG2_9BACL|nr:HAD family hydrolase [Paenibacillus solanacearum]CAG7597179.1 (S)-2-haloacid dehalogenase 4A [Paenibacillus solanacearum]